MRTLRIGLCRSLSVCVVVSAVALAAASARASFIDGFDYPDGTDVGPAWIEQYADWRVEAHQARSLQGTASWALMTVNGFELGQPMALQAEVHYVGPPRPTYVALVALYKDLSNHLFVKVQDNDVNGTYDRVYFYYGHNSHNPWPGMTGGDFYADVTPFTDALLTLVIVGDEVALAIDRDFDSTPEDVISRGGIPIQNLGTAMGVAGYDDACVGSFIAAPEPATLAFVSFAIACLAITRRRRAS